MTIRLRRLLAVTLTAAALTGCAVTVDTVPLPKPGVDGPTYRIQAVFDNALNLPERARVKIGGTDIGVVTAIATVDFLAEVELEISADIELLEGTRAELRQATPLGDMFLALVLPERGPGVRALRDGDRLDRTHTSAGASVEELMMSMSLLLNGGALNQFARITTEMNSMLAGRGPQLAHLLTELTAALDALGRRTGQIDGVLYGLADLTTTMNQRKQQLGTVADTFPALIGVLAENNQAITNLSTKLSVTMAALGDFTATTGPNFVTLFDSVQQLMEGFTRMGGDLAGALDRLHELYPSWRATTEGTSLAVAVTVSYLSVSALTDPNAGKLPDGSDVVAFAGSLTEVLTRVLGRVQGGPR
ncbi:MCE family protein [Nocardia sp. NPDC050712]|uniref:MCE family protein n=1 Tax=Nocardia sp. NPDC050712 TaxID=3155518 RepID=UPI0033DAB644